MIPLWPAYAVLAIITVNCLLGLVKQDTFVGVTVYVAIEVSYLWVLHAGNFFAPLGFPA